MTVDSVSAQPYVEAISEEAFRSVCVAIRFRQLVNSRFLAKGARNLERAISAISPAPRYLLTCRLIKIYFSF